MAEGNEDKEAIKQRALALVGQGGGDTETVIEEESVEEEVEVVDSSPDDIEAKKKRALELLKKKDDSDVPSSSEEVVTESTSSIEVPNTSLDSSKDEVVNKEKVKELSDKYFRVNELQKKWESSDEKKAFDELRTIDLSSTAPIDEATQQAKMAQGDKIIADFGFKEGEYPSDGGQVGGGLTMEEMEYLQKNAGWNLQYNQGTSPHGSMLPGPGSYSFTPAAGDVAQQKRDEIKNNTTVIIKDKDGNVLGERKRVLTEKEADYEENKKMNAHAKRMFLDDKDIKDVEQDQKKATLKQNVDDVNKELYDINLNITGLLNQRMGGQKFKLKPEQLRGEDKKQYEALVERRDGMTKKILKAKQEFNNYKPDYRDEVKIYDMYTGKFVDGLQEMSPQGAQIKKDIDEKVEGYKKTDLNSLQDYRSAAYYNLLDIAKRVKLNSEDVADDRSTFMALAEGLESMASISDMESDDSFVDVVENFPNPEDNELSPNYASYIIKSSHPLAQEYNQSLQNLNALNQAIELNNNAALSGSDYDGNIYADAFVEGFGQMFYGEGTGFDSYKTQVRQPFVEAIKNIGLEGEELEKMEAAIEKDWGEETLTVGGNIAGMVTQMAGPGGVIKAAKIPKLLNAGKVLTTAKYGKWAAAPYSVLQHGGLEAGKFYLTGKMYGNEQYYDPAMGFAFGALTPVAKYGSVLLSKVPGAQMVDAALTNAMPKVYQGTKYIGGKAGQATGGVTIAYAAEIADKVVFKGHEVGEAWDEVIYGKTDANPEGVDPLRKASTLWAVMFASGLSQKPKNKPFFDQLTKDISGSKPREIPKAEIDALKNAEKIEKSGTAAEKSTLKKARENAAFNTQLQGIKKQIEEVQTSEVEAATQTEALKSIVDQVIKRPKKPPGEPGGAGDIILTKEQLAAMDKAGPMQLKNMTLLVEQSVKKGDITKDQGMAISAEITNIKNTARKIDTPNNNTRSKVQELQLEQQKIEKEIEKSNEKTFKGPEATSKEKANKARVEEINNELKELSEQPESTPDLLTDLIGNPKRQEQTIRNKEWQEQNPEIMKQLAEKINPLGEGKTIDTALKEIIEGESKSTIEDSQVPVEKETFQIEREVGEEPVEVEIVTNKDGSRTMKITTGEKGGLQMKKSERISKDNTLPNKDYIDNAVGEIKGEGVKVEGTENLVSKKILEKIEGKGKEKVVEEVIEETDLKEEMMPEGVDKVQLAKERAAAKAKVEGAGEIPTTPVKGKQKSKVPRQKKKGFKSQIKDFASKFRKKKPPVEPPAGAGDVIKESTDPVKENVEVIVSGKFDGLKGKKGNKTIDVIEEIGDLTADAKGKDGQIIETTSPKGERVLSLVKETFDFQGRAGYVGVSVKLPKGSKAKPKDVIQLLEFQLYKVAEGKNLKNEQINSIEELSTSKADKDLIVTTIEDAVQKPSTKKVDVQQQAKDGKAVGKGNTKVEKPTQKVKKESVKTEPKTKEEVAVSEAEADLKMAQDKLANHRKNKPNQKSSEKVLERRVEFREKYLDLQKQRAAKVTKNKISKGEVIETYSNTNKDVVDFSKLKGKGKDSKAKADELVFTTPSATKFSSYGKNKFKIKLKPKKPYYQASNRVWTKAEIKDLKAKGYDAIITHFKYKYDRPVEGVDYQKSQEYGYRDTQNKYKNVEGRDNRGELDISEATEVIPLNENIIVEVTNPKGEVVQSSVKGYKPQVKKPITKTASVRKTKSTEASDLYKDVTDKGATPENAVKSLSDAGFSDSIIKKTLNEAGIEYSSTMKAKVEVSRLKQDLLTQQKGAKTALKLNKETVDRVAKVLDRVAKEVKSFDPGFKLKVEEAKKLLKGSASKDLDINKAEKIVDEMTNALEKVGKQSLIKGIKDTIKKGIKPPKPTKSNPNPKPKISPESIEALDIAKEMLEGVDLNKGTYDQVKAIAEYVKEIQTKGKADKEVADKAKRAENSIIQGTAAESLYKDVNSKELKTEKEVEDFLNKSKGDNFVLVDGKMVDSKFIKDNPGFDYSTAKGYEKMSIETTNTIIGSKSNTTNKQGVTSKQYWTGLINKSKTGLNPLKGVKNIETLLKKVKKGESSAFKKLIDDISTSITRVADYKVEKRQEESKVKTDKIFKETFGSVNKGNKLLNKLAPEGIFKDRKGVEGKEAKIKASNDVVVDLYVSGQVFKKRAAQLRESARNGSKTEKAAAEKKAKELENILETSGVNESKLNEHMDANPQLKEFAKKTLEYYKEMGKSFEQAAIDATGQPFLNPDYYPITRAEKTKEATAEVADTRLDGGGDFTQRSAMVDRLKSADPYLASKIDVTVGVREKMNTYIEQMTHAETYIPISKKINQVINNTTKAKIKKKLGKTDYANLMDNLDAVIDVNYGKAHEQMQGLQKLNRLGVVITLAGKPGNFIKQLTSATHWGYAGLKDGITTPEVWAPLAEIPFSREYQRVAKQIITSPYVRNRIKKSDIDPALKTELLNLADQPAAVVYKRIEQLAMSPIILGDIAGVLGGGVPYAVAKYKKSKTNKKGEYDAKAFEEAYMRFREESSTAQQSGKNFTTGKIQRTALGKLLTTYKTSQTQAVNKTMQGWMEMTDKTNTPAQRRKGFFQWQKFMRASLLFQAVGTGFAYSMISGEATEEDQVEQQLFNTVTETLNSSFQGMGVGGYVPSAIMNILQGKPMEWNLPPLVGKSIGFLKNLDSYINMLDKDYEDLSDFEKEKLDGLTGGVLKNIDKLSKDDADFIKILLSGQDKNYRNPLYEALIKGEDWKRDEYKTFKVTPKDNTPEKEKKGYKPFPKHFPEHFPKK